MASFFAPDWDAADPDHFGPFGVQNA